MILVGLGANLNHPVYGTPRETCEAALEKLARSGVTILARSRWFESAPVPPSDQPWYVNGVARLASDLDPGGLLEILHRVENAFGRVRRERNEARVLDLDLLAYDDLVRGPGSGPVLPHPRMTERAFVILPLLDIAPDWRHPASGVLARDLAEGLSDSDLIRPMDPVAAN